MNVVSISTLVGIVSLIAKIVAWAGQSVTFLPPAVALAVAVTATPALPELLRESPTVGPPPTQVRFTEDFEGDLSRWELYGEQGVALRASGDPAHGGVLALTPHGDVYALVRGSDEWGAVRMEGEVFFPEDTDHYLGVVYNFRRRAERTDFGVVYIKGNGSYLRVNPHRDFNVGRTLYEEYRTPLEGADAIRIAEWQRFKVEIVGARCHFYVGDMAVPKLTFSLLELDHGPVGLQPRSVGGEVWVDNLTVTSIDRLSYRGPDKPRDFDYSTESLLTTWEVVGPLERTMDEVARRPDDPNHPWRAFETDARGAVITARVADYHGPRTVAYFRTRVRSDVAGEAFLHISTVDDLAVWVNGRFHWFISRSRLAWYDFWTNENHAGQRIPVDLIAGENEIVIRVRGGVYASGGFFAGVEGPAY